MKRDANELGNILENSLETPELQAHNSLKKVTKKPWNSTFHGFLWWTRRDSNPRPLGCEPNALPTELRARLCLVWINLTHLDCAICWSAWARVMSPLLSQLSYGPIYLSRLTAKRVTGPNIWWYEVLIKGDANRMGATWATGPKEGAYNWPACAPSWAIGPYWLFF